MLKDCESSLSSHHDPTSSFSFSYLQTCFYGDYSQLSSFPALVLFFSFFLSIFDIERNITQLDFPFTCCVCYFKIYRESENILFTLWKPNIFMLNCDCSDKFSVRNSFSFISFPFLSFLSKSYELWFLFLLISLYYCPCLCHFASSFFFFAWFFFCFCFFMIQKIKCQ